MPRAGSGASTAETPSVRATRTKSFRPRSSATARASSLRAVRLVGATPVRRPIVALRRKDAGAPLGAVAGFLEALRETAV